MDYRLPYFCEQYFPSSNTASYYNLVFIKSDYYISQHLLRNNVSFYSFTTRNLKTGNIIS